MKKLIAILFVFFSFNASAQCFDDAKIKSYDKCFYVSFIIDGRIGSIGVNVPFGIPAQQYIRQCIVSDIHCTINNIFIREVSAMSQADYKEFFKGSYRRVIFNKK